MSMKIVFNSCKSYSSVKTLYFQSPTPFRKIVQPSKNIPIQAGYQYLMLQKLKWTASSDEPAGYSHILMGDIFYSLQLGKLSNISLLLRLCAGWFIDVIILSTWVAIDPITIHLKMIDEEVNKHGSLFVWMWFFRCCLYCLWFENEQVRGPIIIRRATDLIVYTCKRRNEVNIQPSSPNKLSQ